MKVWLGGLAIAVAVLLYGPGSTRAGYLVYTTTDIESGQIGTQTFTNALVSYTTVADTNNITSTAISGGVIYQVPNTSATVTIAGIGTASLTAMTQTFDNQTHGGVAGLAFATTSSQAIILADINAALLTYNLNGPINVPGGVPLANPSIVIGTSLGNLVITGDTGPGTFSAAVPSVPEPSSFVLVGVFGAFAGIAGWLRRRRAA